MIADVIRRYVEGAGPSGVLMMSMTALAAVVNMACLRLLRGMRQRDVNLRAAWTFSTNDLLSNLGVIVAGLLVWWLDEAWPDLTIGLAIALLAAKGGVRIFAMRRGPLDE